ncbi:MAG: hypothetical protein V1837_00230 [Candidatus Woesearchaeota archaeon]
MELPEKFTGNHFVEVYQRRDGPYDAVFITGIGPDGIDESRQVRQLRRGIGDRFVCYFARKNRDFYMKVMDWAAKLDPKEQLQSCQIELSDILQ